MGMLTHLILLTKDKGMFGLKKTLKIRKLVKVFFCAFEGYGCVS